MTTGIVAGIDLGGTAINYTFLDPSGRFLVDGLCEHPARSVEGPDVCLAQIVDGLRIGGADREHLTNPTLLVNQILAHLLGRIARRGEAGKFLHP
jgi:hypothetical protein